MILRCQDKLKWEAAHQFLNSIFHPVVASYIENDSQQFVTACSVNCTAITPEDILISDRLFDKILTKRHSHM